jgi:hypothetical protein
MFGEGVHPKFGKLLDTELAPFLSQGASNFWYMDPLLLPNPHVVDAIVFLS